MKYLKYYERIDYRELESICKEHLAYLMDIGFEVSLPVIEDECALTIRPISPQGRFGEHNNFRWSDIKDYIIPFLTIIDSEYRLIKFNIRFYGAVRMSYKIQDIIDDKVDIDYMVDGTQRGNAKKSISYIEIPIVKNKRMK